MKIEGIASYIDKAGKHHSIEGIGSLPDNNELQSLNVSGEFSFDTISCEDMKVSGSCEGKTLTAKNISAEGTIEVAVVNVAENFKLSGSAEIKSLVAKEIIMESRGGSINSIKCDKLKIFHGEIREVGASIFSKIFGGKTSHNNSRVRIEKIDAETIHLENCAVVEIKCKDAFIGSNCAIDKLLVSGECKVADDSTVGETIHT